MAVEKRGSDGHEKVEIQSLSDLVFGLAISIGGIALVIGNVNSQRPLDILVDILVFSVGFIIVISIWFNYTRAMNQIEIETGWEMTLNVLLLLFVSLEPYLLNVLAFSTIPRNIDFASTAYAIDIGVIMVILATFYNTIMVEKKKNREIHGSLANRHQRDLRLVDASIFLISALPIFWAWELFGIKVRYILWGAAIVPAIAVRVHNMRAHHGKD